MKLNFKILLFMGAVVLATTVVNLIITGKNITKQMSFNEWKMSFNEWKMTYVRLWENLNFKS